MPVVEESAPENPEQPSGISSVAYPVPNTGPGAERARASAHAQRAAVSEAKAGFFVANAGLVILHPYLKYLLERTAALRPDGTPNHGRAAMMLHYAVFGEGTQPEEWDLPLTKLLLGLAPNDLLLPDEAIHADDKTVVNELLEGVIGHWSALKSTRPAGLQEAFLQRAGKLTLAPGGYVLTVETTTLDLLLDRLPWSISLVKSPWMKQALQVRWR